MENFTGEHSGVTYTGAEFNSGNYSQSEKAMSTGEKIRQRLLWTAALGLCLLVTGLSLLWLTPVSHSGNPADLAATAILIALGLLLLIPAKVYIILQFTRNRRQGNNN